jgi:hypothetical protein
VQQKTHPEGGGLAETENIDINILKKHGCWSGQKLTGPAEGTCE